MPANRKDREARRRSLATLAEAAQYAACSQRTIRRRIASGDLVGYRLGRMIRVDLDQLDAALRPIPASRRQSA